MVVGVGVLGEVDKKAKISEMGVNGATFTLLCGCHAYFKEGVYCLWRVGIDNLCLRG